jgi:RNA polymerase-binding transcription factor DksA
MLREQLARATEQLAALQTEYDQLLADPDVIQEDRDATALLLEHARRQEAAARDAVSRLDDGSYGRCARCGDDIAPERLAALVDVTTCVRCAG